MSTAINSVVLGATGYVGGELLRLLAGHPSFTLKAAVSGSSGGERIADTFPHLGAAVGETRFLNAGDWLDGLAAGEALAVFSAAPHGASAAMIDEVLDAAKRAGTGDVHVVDASADFRFADQADYESIYGKHGAPARLAQFMSGLPEHVTELSAPHVGNPGCFATAMLLAIVPLLDADITSNRYVACGITGSTGSGRAPVPGTHHPVRHSNLYAYKPLDHRHAPEVVSLAALATGREASLAFVPHSGPFARGIHMTVTTEAREPIDTTTLSSLFEEAYAEANFVQLVDGMPRLKDVVASNYAHIGVAARGREIAVTTVIDNLVKGAAGGAVQWMNRLFDLPETTGLDTVAPAWT